MTYKGQITELMPNEIFVFGSNTQGRHGKGAALFAKQKCGAIYGQARGRQGQSYAIVTKDLTMDYNLPSVEMISIRAEVCALYEHAKRNPDLNFLVAYSGTGTNLNNYSNQEMADIFYMKDIPSNIVFEEEFSKLMH